MKDINDLTYELNGAAMEVHRVPGPGLLESVYEAALCRELALRKIVFVRQAEIPVSYKGELLECGFRADIVVDQRVILELKAIDQILPLHEAQLLNYLKLTHLPLGLLINFNVPILKADIRRFVNQLPDSSAVQNS